MARPTQAHLSDEAISGFARWADRHGLDRTSLIEGLGRFLNGHDPTETHQLTTEDLVAIASTVHRERRARPQK
jgi:hypothetical protein